MYLDYDLKYLYYVLLKKKKEESAKQCKPFPRAPEN